MNYEYFVIVTEVVCNAVLSIKCINIYILLYYNKLNVNNET